MRFIYLHLTVIERVEDFESSEKSYCHKIITDLAKLRLDANRSLKDQPVDVQNLIVEVQKGYVFV